MHIKCKTDLEIDIFSKNKGLKCSTNFVMLSKDDLALFSFIISIISVLNLFPTANKIKRNKSAKLLKELLKAT